MSDRRRRYRDESLVPEPIIIERKPRSRTPSPRRRRSVSFGINLNPFKSTKRTVVVKESSIRRRRQDRRSVRTSRSPSRSPPRGPNHIMDPRIGDAYVPLPKALPPKEEKDSTSESERGKKSRRRKAKIIHEPHPEDEDAYPHTETPSPNRRDRSRRDSGKYSMEGSPLPRKYYDHLGRPTFPPSHGDDVQAVTDQFNTLLTRERLDRVEAEKAALRAKAEAQGLKAELERVKRQSWLDERERNVSDREKQNKEDQRRISDIPATYPPRDVVVIQPDPPARYNPTGADAADDALKRARDDYKRRSGKGY